MVDNMADDVAIVHQVPFTCDRIDNSPEHIMSSVTSDSSTNPSSFLKFGEKKQYHDLTKKKQRRFVATLEKVRILINNLALILKGIPTV